MKHFGSGATAMAVMVAALLSGTVAGCAAGVGPEPADAASDDAGITAGVEAAVAADERLRTGDIRVDTDRGVVQLSGFVGSAEDVATAAAAARTVKGVRSIRNDLRLK